MTPQEFKQQLLNKLYEPYKKCTMCPLGLMGRKNVVFGQGNPDADLMFIGEGPGQEEDNQGLPFVGRSGQLLNKILQAVNMSREEVFITNIVKCRPPNNRKPMPQESETCKNLLLINQIKIIRPTIICTLGSAAIQGLLNDYDIKISKIRGSFLSYQEIPVLPTYHPAYILRNPKELDTLYTDIEHAVKYATTCTKKS
ncbi:MAG: uracil-DNA glycosylase [Candidatus Dependentiae bacterium]